MAQPPQSSGVRTRSKAHSSAAFIAPMADAPPIVGSPFAVQYSMPLSQSESPKTPRPEQVRHTLSHILIHLNLSIRRLRWCHHLSPFPPSSPRRGKLKAPCLRYLSVCVSSHTLILVTSGVPCRQF